MDTLFSNEIISSNLANKGVPLPLKTPNKHPNGVPEPELKATEPIADSLQKSNFFRKTQSVNLETFSNKIFKIDETQSAIQTGINQVPDQFNEKLIPLENQILDQELFLQEGGQDLAETARNQIVNEPENAVQVQSNLFPEEVFQLIQ